MTDQTPVPAYAQPLMKAGARFRALGPEFKFTQERDFMLSIARGNELLRQCDPDSFRDCVLQAHAMGLSLNPSLQHCYAISYLEKNSNIRYVYASPGYRGLAHLAVKGGGITAVRAEIIYVHDIMSNRFVYRGPSTKAFYEPDLLKTRQEKDAAGVYTEALLPDGRVVTKWHSREYILKCKAKSKRKTTSMMWDKNDLWHEGWLKTGVRNDSKLWPHVAVPMQRAIEQMDKYEGMDPARIDVQHETVSKAPPAEIVYTITTDDVERMRASIKSAGSKDPDKWLGKIAATYGVEKIDDLPMEQCAEAEEKLKMGLAQQKQRRTK